MRGVFEGGEDGHGLLEGGRAEFVGEGGIGGFPVGNRAAEERSAGFREAGLLALTAAAADGFDEAAAFELLDASDHGGGIDSIGIGEHDDGLAGLAGERDEDSELSGGEPELAKVGVIVAREGSGGHAGAVADAYGGDPMKRFRVQGHRLYCICSLARERGIGTWRWSGVWW